MSQNTPIITDAPEAELAGAIVRLKVLPDGRVAPVNGHQLPKEVSVEDPVLLSSIARLRAFFYCDFVRVIVQRTSLTVQTDGVDLEASDLIDLRLTEPSLPPFSQGTFRVSGFVGKPIIIPMSVTPKGLCMDHAELKRVSRFVDEDLFKKWLSSAVEYCKFALAKGSQGGIWLEISSEGPSILSFDESFSGMPGSGGSESLVVITVGPVRRKFLINSHSNPGIIFGNKEAIAPYFPDGTFSDKNLSTARMSTHIIGLGD